MTEPWRLLSEKVRNWGRWGEEDQLGTLNLITPEHVVRAAGLVRTGKAFPLAIPLNADGPMGAHGFRRNPVHILTVDGGDEDIHERLQGATVGLENETRGLYQAGPFRFNDDWIIMPLQASTQWDALSHGYYEKTLYNGFPASSVNSHGAGRNSIDIVAEAGRVVGRGVLLDVARHRGVPHLEAGEVILPEELDAVASAQGVTVGEGDIVVIRTGWWSTYTVGGGTWGSNDPGVSWRVAEWLWEKNVAAVASDNVAVEVMIPEDGVILPFHMLTLRDMGLTLGEIWNLEALAADCAADGVYEFFLTAPPLNVTGGVGSPINPVAIK